MTDKEVWMQLFCVFLLEYFCFILYCPGILKGFVRSETAISLTTRDTVFKIYYCYNIDDISAHYYR